MSAQSKSVTIVGAGIAGLTTAICLAKAADKSGQNIQIQLFERTKTPSEEGAGLQLSPNVTHILRKLGILDQIIACAGIPQNIVMADGKSGRNIADIPLGEFAENRFGAPYLVVHRAELHQILLATALNMNCISITYDQQVKTLDAKADLIIGADGVWSTTKTLIGKQQANPVQFAGHIAWRALIDDQALILKYKQSTHVWLGAKAHIVLYPISGNEKLNLVMFTEGELLSKSWAQNADIEQLMTHVGDWNSDVLDLVEHAKNLKIWPLFVGKPEYQTAQDNILFIGDAAHPTLPYQAQGAAMAIEDAACLANLLYAGAENWHFWQADILALKLRIFEASRHDRVVKTQQAALQNAKIFHLAPPISWARNIYLRFLTRFARNSLLTRLDWLYSKRYDNF